MAAVVWSTTHDAMVAALATATESDQRIGEDLLRTLDARGDHYDNYFTPECDAAKVAGDATYAAALATWQARYDIAAAQLARVTEAEVSEALLEAYEDDLAQVTGEHPEGFWDKPYGVAVRVHVDVGRWEIFRPVREIELELQAAIDACTEYLEALA
jgi:hypothetical protein